MQLHRTTGKPDWADVPADKRNVWQRLAAASGGVATPSNAITVVGIAIVVYGLFALADKHYWLSLGAIVLGRIFDLADGIVANATGTKSPLGEIMDASADKLTVLGVVIAFWAAHLVPVWLLLVIVLPHFLISLLSVAAYFRQKPLHPSRFGKYNMAAIWVIAPGFVVCYGLHMSQGWLMTTLRVLAVANATAGLYIAYQYARGRD